MNYYTSLALLALLVDVRPFDAFVDGFSMPAVIRHRLRPTTQFKSSSSSSEMEIPQMFGVVAPLIYKGPYYPCLSLIFPERNNNESFQFILDTGANVNSIQSDLVKKHKLSAMKNMGTPLATSGMGGNFAPGDLVKLGDCKLDGLPPEQSHLMFMRGLTAASLPHASPLDTSGLLGTPFFQSFAGVEFDWYGTDGDPPTFIFYFGEDLPDSATKDMAKVPLQRLEVDLFTVNISINGAQMPALLDTGSPITVINPKAAKDAGIEMASLKSSESNEVIGLKVGGVDGNEMTLQKSRSPVSIEVSPFFSLGEGHVFVGDLPGLAFLESVLKLSAEEQEKDLHNTPPAAILGLDSLRRAYRVIIQAGKGELWLEELNDTKPIYRAS